MRRAPFMITRYLNEGFLSFPTDTASLDILRHFDSLSLKETLSTVMGRMFVGCVMMSARQ